MANYKITWGYPTYQWKAKLLGGFHGFNMFRLFSTPSKTKPPYYMYIIDHVPRVFRKLVFQFFRFNPGQAVSPHADAARWWNCMSFTASCQNSLHHGGKRFNPWRTLGHAGRKVSIGQPVSHGVSVILGGFVKQALRFLDVFIRFYSIKQILRRHSLFPEKTRCFCWSFLLADGQVTAVRHMSRWWVYSNQ